MECGPIEQRRNAFVERRHEQTAEEHEQGTPATRAA
jgi:hypothetical protein